MSNLHFGNPWVFLLLLLLPLFAWMYIRRGFGGGGAVRYSDLSRLRTLPVSWSMRLRHLLFVLRMLALILLVAALARPQASFRTSEVRSHGVDIVMALDLSTSMAAEDLRAKTSRIDVAKEVAQDFVDQRENDRIGLVSFAKYASLKCPLTLHHALLESFIERLHTSRLITEGFGQTRPEEPGYDGTAIGSGLANAVRLLRESDAESKVVVLLTDGQNNMGLHPLDAAQAAKAFDVKVYTIGVGSRGRAPIPVYHPHFGKQYAHQPVDIDEDTLKQIAAETDGKYFRAVDAGALQQVFREIDRLERTEVVDEAFVRYEERFAGFALAALALLVLEQLLAHTRFRTLP